MEEEARKETEFREKYDKENEGYWEALEEAESCIRSGIGIDLEGGHPADIASLINDLEIESGLTLLRTLEPAIQSYVLIKLEEERVSTFLEEMTPEEIAEIFEETETDDTSYFLAILDEDKRNAILSKFSKKESLKLRNQLGFREYTAGRIMSKDFATVSKNANVRSGIIQVRKKAKEIEDIYQVYVIDEEGVLEGFVPLKDLFLSPINTKISKIMNYNLYSFHYDTDQEEVANTFRKYDLVSAAVVDDMGRIIGRITVDDVLEVVEEEASEDILRLGGVSEDERLSTPIFSSLKRRITWLHVNLLTAFLSSSVVAFFEDTISQIVVLATLMPIVAGLGGNAGTQSITVIIRNLATGDLTLSNWWEAVKKEIVIGASNGIILGTLTATLIYLVKGNMILSVVVGSAMLINMMIASLVGSLVPLVLKKVGIDPAIASSIFVTASTDISGFFFFLGLATLLLKTVAP